MAICTFSNTRGLVFNSQVSGHQSSELFVLLRPSIVDACTLRVQDVRLLHSLLVELNGPMTDRKRCSCVLRDDPISAECLRLAHFASDLFGAQALNTLPPIVPSLSAFSLASVSPRTFVLNSIFLFNHLNNHTYIHRNTTYCFFIIQLWVWSAILWLSPKELMNTRLTLRYDNCD